MSIEYRVSSIESSCLCRTVVSPRTSSSDDHTLLTLCTTLLLILEGEQQQVADSEYNKDVLPLWMVRMMCDLVPA